MGKVRSNSSIFNIIIAITFGLCVIAVLASLDVSDKSGSNHTVSAPKTKQPLRHLKALRRQMVAL